MTDLSERLAARTEALVAIPSESGEEAAMLEAVRAQLPGPLTVVDDEDAVLLALPARRQGAPLILLAGHVDTVPLGESAPRRREGGTIHGRGAADMKGGIAVLLEVAEALADRRVPSELDVGSSASVGRSSRSRRAPSSRCSRDGRRSATPRSRSSSNPPTTPSSSAASGT